MARSAGATGVDKHWTPPTGKHHDRAVERWALRRRRTIAFVLIVVVAAILMTSCGGTAHVAKQQQPRFQLPTTAPFLPGLPVYEGPGLDFSNAVTKERFAASAGDLRSARSYFQDMANIFDSATVAQVNSIHFLDPGPQVESLQTVQLAANVVFAALTKAATDPSDADFNANVDAANRAQTTLRSAGDQLNADCPIRCRARYDHVQIGG